jgi:iron complex transport system substrate-binding protein
MRRGRLAWLLLGLLGCEQPAERPPPASGPRIVSLHDVTTEMLVELGALDRVVGVSPPVDAMPHVERAVAAVPRVAGLESIMAQRPSVVLGMGVTAEREPEMVARLREAGIDVQLADPAVIDDVYALARTVARRAQRTAQGEKLVAELRARMEGGAPRAPAQRKRVFVYDCCDPPFTAGGKTVLSDLIERAGGRNVFADLDADWTNVSWEQVLARRPELIVIHAYRYDGQGDVSEKRKALAAIPGLAEVPVVVVPLGCSLGGLRSAEGLTRLRAGIEGRS